MSIAEINPQIDSNLLVEHDLQIHYDYESELAAQLVENSRQPHILKWTPEDAERTFITQHSTERWGASSENPPLFVWLGNAANELAGIAFMINGQSRELGPPRIFGARVYEGYLNRGLGTLLGLELHQRYDKSRSLSTRFYMPVQNNAAFALGLKLGYTLSNDHAVSVPAGKMAMVRNRR